MKKYALETTVGIFVFVGLLCVGYMAVKLGDLDLFGDQAYTLYARFTSVSGLRVGSKVEMLGLPIGVVSGFKLDQDNQMAIVAMRIKKGIRIYDDAIASVKTSGLIGDRYVSIDPGGGGDLLKPGDTITETEPPIDIGELLGKYAFGSVSGKNGGK